MQCLADHRSKLKKCTNLVVLVHLPPRYYQAPRTRTVLFDDSDCLLPTRLILDQYLAIDSTKIDKIKIIITLRLTFQ